MKIYVDKAILLAIATIVGSFVIYFLQTPKDKLSKIKNITVTIVIGVILTGFLAVKVVNQESNTQSENINVTEKDSVKTKVKEENPPIEIKDNPVIPKILKNQEASVELTKQFNTALNLVYKLKQSEEGNNLGLVFDEDEDKRDLKPVLITLKEMAKKEKNTKIFNWTEKILKDNWDE